MKKFDRASAWIVNVAFKKRLVSRLFVEEFEAMKRNKSLIVGLLCGVLCACCVFAYTQVLRNQVIEERNEALARYGGEQIEVCVAKRDIAAGETIDESCTETRTWLADLLPAGAFANSQDVAGMRASSDIYAGEVLLEKRFSQGMQTLSIPQGLTALSVPAQNVQAVGGALAPGSRVDVYATGATSTKLIGQDILVVATDVSSESSSTANISWITLAVKPSSVQEMVAAVASAELYFTLPTTQVELSAKHEENQ